MRVLLSSDPARGTQHSVVLYHDARESLGYIVHAEPANTLYRFENAREAAAAWLDFITRREQTTTALSGDPNDNGSAGAAR